MGFTRFPADRRHRCRRPTFLTGAVPFGAFPSRPGRHRHRALSGAFTDCLAPLAVGPLPPLASKLVCAKRSLHLRGFPTESPWLDRSVAAVTGLVAPLGFPLDSRLSPAIHSATLRGRSQETPCSMPDRSREPPAARPAEANRTDRPDRRSRTSRRRSSHRSGRRDDAGSRDRAREFPHEHPQSKLCVSAAAFQATPLPVRP